MNELKRSIPYLFSSTIANLRIFYKISLFFVIIIGIIFISFSLTQYKKSVENALSNSAAQINKTISYDIDYVKYQLFYATKQIALLGGNEKQVEKLLATFVTNVNNQIDIALTWNAFSWINANDKLVIDGTAGILSQKVDMSDREYLDVTRNTSEKIVFGKTRLGALSQRLIMPAATGVFSNRGAYIGTLVFGFDVEKILIKIDKSIVNPNISYAFLRDDAFLFGSDNFNQDNIGEMHKLLEPYKDKDEINKTIISSAGFFGNHSTVFFQKIKGYPISFVVFYNKTAYQNHLLSLFLQRLFLILFVCAALYFLFKTVQKKIVNPITKISKFSAQLLNRDFNCELEKPESKDFDSIYSAMNLLRDSFKREEELVNQLKLANQKIAQENFNKSEFLSAISHDLRNPLAAIISFAEFMRDKNNDTNYDELAKDIELCALDALEFINDLMDVAQTASGEFSINMSNQIDISETIKRSIRMNRDFAHKRKISIISEIEQGLAPINLDARRMKQILVNLISNSIKYSDESTEIRVSATTIIQGSRQRLRIIVQDQGFGMDEQQVKKAMEKYGRVHESKAHIIDSFGLGLPLVKQMTELQMGEFAIKSQANKGTQVVLVFDYN